MNAANLMAELTRLGVRLEAHDERLRYSPKSAMTPELVDRLKTHKAELLELLRPEANRPTRPQPAQRKATAKLSDDVIEWALTVWEQPKAVPPQPPRHTRAENGVCRCGSTEWRDVRIHNGQSIRRDCVRCDRFLQFTVWYGN